MRSKPNRSLAAITAAYAVVAIVVGYHGNRLASARLPTLISSVSSGSAIAILAAIASGTMALTAIVFSLMFVGLQVSATAYTPRLVGAFGGGHAEAHVLGLFVGTFLYALLAIRSVDIGGRPGVNVTVLATTLLWLLASVASLVFLLSASGRFTISGILQKLARDGVAAASQVFAGHETAAEVEPRASFEGLEPCLVHEGAPMYLVGLDERGLIALAVAADTTFVVPFAVGDAVMPGDALVLAHPRARPSLRRLRKLIRLAPERSIAEDPAYALRLLVDIAIRALSPAINDPTTAVSALDAIDPILRVLAGRRLALGPFTDGAGQVRLARTCPRWDDYVALALTEIHHYGRDSLQVQRRIETLVRDLARVVPPLRREALVRFERWRVGTLSEAVSATAPWVGALAYDRQGLGHEEAGADRMGWN